ncbi:MAG: hypothetical protein WA208_01800, partial [Thermoanaerobaculia bacterium]
TGVAALPSGTAPAIPPASPKAPQPQKAAAPGQQTQWVWLMDEAKMKDRLEPAAVEPEVEEEEETTTVEEPRTAGADGRRRRRRRSGVRRTEPLSGNRGKHLVEDGESEPE